MGRKDEYNTFERQLGRFHSALDFLESNDIPVVPSSRLRAYERRLEQVTNDPNPYQPLALANQVTFDLREIDEVIEIAESFKRAPTPAELSRLRELPKGHEDPDHRGDQRARDAQYELFLRAILVSDGHPVEMEEPDLLVSYDSVTLQLAAKRPKCVARLDDRLRAAVSQVERRNEPAVIAISLDHLIRPAGPRAGERQAEERYVTSKTNESNQTGEWGERSFVTPLLGIPKIVGHDVTAERVRQHDHWCVALGARGIKVLDGRTDDLMYDGVCAITLEVAVVGQCISEPVYHEVAGRHPIQFQWSTVLVRRLPHAVHENVFTGFHHVGPVDLLPLKARSQIAEVFAQLFDETGREAGFLRADSVDREYADLFFH